MNRACSAVSWRLAVENCQQQAKSKKKNYLLPLINDDQF
jgi:hypothetical protein